MKYAISPRKIIGTLAVAVVLSLGAFGTAKAAEAMFVGAGRTLIFDGTVGSVGSNSITLYTTSTDPITVAVNRRTSFQGHLRLRDIDPGDNLKIVAQRRNGELVAQRIKREGGVSGYGTAGDHVLVSRGTVIAKAGSTFTVRTNGVEVTFHVTGATRFFGGSFAGLQIGNRVVVIGTDTGSSSTGFVARTVFR